MKQIFLKWLAVLALLFGQLSPTTVTAANNQVTIASFDAAQPGDVPKIDGATEYVYSTGEIPVTAFPADASERKIIFGSKLSFARSGAKPAAHYQIKATFLSDSDDRLQRIEVNGHSLEDHLALPKWQVVERVWSVPAGTVGAEGDFVFTISRLQGANAVLSSLKIISDVSQTLSAPPPLEDALAKITVPMPRLSPRPKTVTGIRTPLVSLDGTWKFHPAPPAGFEKFTAAQTKTWAKIQVPGEWTMQGFDVKTNSAAAYWREFEMPAHWRGQRIKLRFDTIHSDCRVFVNGHEIGAHEGCFTAFELDATDVVHPGRNTLALAVKSESTADVLASATQYAAHQLGGITRKVQLFALPEINLASQMVSTTFDESFQNAQLNIHIEVENESVRAGEAVAQFSLIDPAGKVVSVTMTNLPVIRAGQGRVTDYSVTVNSPKKWDSEHPNLYTLNTELLLDEKVIQAVTQHIGFRQIEVRGNQLFVNGAPIKLRGACRHEVDPLRGRSLTPELWRKDAELFRAANVNYIRTSHYPPAEEFLDLCDEYGFFVECEAPLCWVNHGANSIWSSWDYRDKKFFAYLLRANLENLAANREHPSVIIWSLANESRWSPLFAEVNRRVKIAEPTRPTSFHDQCWGDFNNATSQADIAVYHYPGENGPAKCDAEKRPVLFGEYCHVECYNRRELATDPGVRDDWGRGFARMSDLMYEHDGCLGGAIWAAIDDVFCLPNGKFVGYGMWGSICDGWRRAKPETWHVQKTYSPVRVTTNTLPLPAAGKPLHVPVENRYNFADLSEVGIAWNVGSERGKLKASLPARSCGELVVTPRSKLKVGDVLHLVFTDPRGFVCDEENISLGKIAEVVAVSGKTGNGKLVVSQTTNQIQIKGGAVEYVIDRQTGQFVSGKLNGKTILTGGPSLMILPLQSEACEPVDLGVWKPLNNVCDNWQAKSVTAAEAHDGKGTVTVAGANQAADGGYVIHLDAAGAVQVSYNFVSKLKENPRQWGVVLFAPQPFRTLDWQRHSQWSFYPAENIGRPVGSAKARPETIHRPYAMQSPDHAWSQDATELGGNDFSSTKVAIREASLVSQASQLKVTSDGHQSVRAFLAGERTGLLITGFHSGGGDSFFNTHLAKERQLLNPGSKLSDTIQVQLKNN